MCLFTHRPRADLGWALSTVLAFRAAVRRDNAEGMSDDQTSASQPHDAIPPVDTTTPHMTARGILTGAVIGGVLSVTNIYAGLKVGWGFNMSIAACLIGYGFWQGLGRNLFGTRDYNVLENNVAQTGASAAASISSAGLVSAVPALTILSGYQWSWGALALWILCCSILGVFVAVLFRRQMLIQDRLPFASGVATAETLREMYARGAEAMARLKALLGGAAGAAALKVVSLTQGWAPVGLPGSFSAASGSALAAKGVSAVTPLNLTFALDPSIMLFGSGMIVGVRTGAWMFIGAIIAWGVIGLDLLGSGVVAPPKTQLANYWLPFLREFLTPDQFDAFVAAERQKLAVPWFKSMVEWLLWPGVAMLVTSSLTSLAFSAPAMVRAFRRGAGEKVSADFAHDVSPRVLWGAMFVIGLVTVIAAAALFDMSPHIAILGIALTFILAVVALRVSGETNITPVGAMGKVTQLTFGVADPGNVSTNLMAANITGGSASQAGDMMHDLKTGLLLGCSPRAQVLSQCVGVLSGSLVGAFAYIILVPDPAAMLLTTEWPAPAVAQWKSVAEVLRDGLDRLPPGVLDAIQIAALAGVLMSIVEKLVPAKVRPWVPSPTAIGIAFCIPGYNGVSMFLGGVTGAVIKRFAPGWHTRFMVVFAAGLIVGESLVGLVDAFMKLL